MTADPFRIIHAEFIAGAGTGGALPPPTTVEIAFAGRSNVGKSSLINALVGRKSLVRTSSTPGSTRQINLYDVRAADGTVLHLVDLPGYGFTRRSKAEMAEWAVLIERYLAQRVTLGVVVVLVDIRRGLEDDDRALIDFIDAKKDATRRPVEVILVATKIDKLAKNARRPAAAGLEKRLNRKIIGFSAVTQDGRIELWRAIRKAALGNPEPSAPAPPGLAGPPAPAPPGLAGPDQNG
jgi:GTP-binding protein